VVTSGDSTIVRGRQHNVGAQKIGGGQAIGPSRGGLSTKIQTLVSCERSCRTIPRNCLSRAKKFSMRWRCG
jgi:hypothetical protein